MRNFDRDHRNDTRGPRFAKKSFGSRKFGDRERSFDKPRFGGRDNFGARNSGSKTMFEAVCSECGDRCQVPFKPNGRKPIFCSQCFEKQGAGSSERSFDRPRFDREDRGGFKDKSNDALVANLKAQLDEVNSKLDKILRTLSRTNKIESTALDFGESESEEEVEMTPAPKKKGYPKKAGQKKNKSKKFE